MPKTHQIVEGDCVESVAELHGHFWETVWNDPANAELKQARGDHTTLEPGDVLHGVPSRLRVRFVDTAGDPRVADFVVRVDGVVTEGALDDGWIDLAISPRARRASIRLIVSADEHEEHELLLGGLAPVDTITGVQARLHNLGHYVGPIDGEEGEALELAVLAFQADQGIEPSGLVTDETRAALRSMCHE
jgi:Putative peptidoglycan binding domain